MTKQKRRIQRPSYKAAATDLANRLNKTEDELLVMCQRLSIATSQLHDATVRNEALHERNKRLKEANRDDQESIKDLLKRVARLGCELAEKDKQLDQSRSVSVVMALGWRLDLDGESQQLDIRNVQNAFTESKIDPKGLQRELMVALMGSYSIFTEIEIKNLK